MKLSLKRTDLLTALAVVKPAASGRSLPILSHVALRLFENSMELTCNNLDLALRTKCDAEVHRKGETTVNCALLHRLAASFAGDTVTLELTKAILTVACGESRYELPVLPLEDFPPATKPKAKEGDEFTLPQATLRAMLHSTSFAASSDASRFILNSSLIKLNGEVTTVSTDGRHLCEMRHAAELPDAAERQLLLPLQAVAELLRLLSDDTEGDAQVRVIATDTAAEFKFGDTLLTTKLIEGNYPNYKQVIPSLEGMTGIQISRPELLAALQRVAIVTEVVVLKFKKQCLTITQGAAKENLGTASEVVMTSLADKVVKTKFNVRYLIDALGVLDDEDVLFYGTDGKSPGVFRTPENSKRNAGWNYVIMPMTSQDEKPDADEPVAAAADEKK